MNAQDFACSYRVDQSPEEVFAAIVDVPRWWTGEVDGSFDQVGDEFTYRYGDFHYSKQGVIAVVPAEKVVWRVVDSRLLGTDDPNEWTGTEITFEIARNDDQTELSFAHHGLRPDLACFDSCSSAWSFYINSSLRRLITTGEGPTLPPWAS
jgi:uncharacterized protein YndB with AHSA1/START domain